MFEVTVRVDLLEIRGNSVFPGNFVLCDGRTTVEVSLVDLGERHDIFFLDSVVGDSDGRAQKDMVFEIGL